MHCQQHHACPKHTDTKDTALSKHGTAPVSKSSPTSSIVETARAAFLASNSAASAASGPNPLLLLLPAAARAARAASRALVGFKHSSRFCSSIGSAHNSSNEAPTGADRGLPLGLGLAAAAATPRRSRLDGDGVHPSWDAAGVVWGRCCCCCCGDGLLAGAAAECVWSFCCCCCCCSSWTRLDTALLMHRAQAERIGKLCVLLPRVLTMADSIICSMINTAADTAIPSAQHHYCALWTSQPTKHLLTPRFPAASSETTLRRQPGSIFALCTAAHQLLTL